MTKSFLNFGLFATTVFICSFGAGLAIPVSLYSETSVKHHSEENSSIVNVNVNDTNNSNHVVGLHDAEVKLNASLHANVNKTEVEQWREHERDHGYKHDMMQSTHPIHGRKLLRRHSRSPPPAPARAPPPAPARAPTPARAPAPKPHTLPHAPAPRAQVVTKAAPPPPVKAEVKAKTTNPTKGSKPSKSKASKGVKTPTTSPSIKVAATVAAPTVVTAAALNVKKQESATDKWLVTAEGVHAAQFCKSLGIVNKPQIYNGCIEDMMVLKSEEIAKLGALTAEEFLAKDKSALASKRYCIASGDPHFTSYDRDIYHLQEKGIFVIASSDDDKFEVQEHVKKNGADKPGVPCCIIGAVVRFGDVSIEVDVYNYGKIRVNGVVTDLAKDATKTFGGVQVKYGKQNIAWRGEKDQTTAMTITGPAGFSVMIEGGYCGTLEVNAPTAYFGKMKGLCGNADGTATNADFSAPDGKVMDVKRGTKDWQMSGYGGPTSPLSKWELSWKPTGAECLFASGCEPALSTPLIIHTKRAAEKAAAAAATAAAVVKTKADAVKSDAIKVTPAKPADVTPVAATPAAVAVTVIIPKERVVSEIIATIPKTNGNLEKFQTKLKSILTEMNSDQLKVETENRNNFNGASVTLKNEQLRLETSTKQMKSLYDETQRLNATIQMHYKKLIADTQYLQVLDAMRPAFLQSLGELASHIQALKTTVDKTIVKDEYKDEMITLLTGIHVNTNNISGYVATAFINHYNKYKALIKNENAGYSEDLKRLSNLATEYKLQAQKTKDIEMDRARIQEVLTKFKESLTLSVTQREEFESLVKDIVSIFTRNARSHCQ